MKRVVFVVALGLLLCSCSNKVAKTEGKPYGVNMACADFGSNFPGVYNTDYTYPQASDLDYWNEKELKLVRFPFKWERLQYEYMPGHIDLIFALSNIYPLLPSADGLSRLPE